MSSMTRRLRITGGLTVGVAVEVVEQARDDSRRRDVGDAAEEHRGGGRPTQDEAHGDAWHGIREDVEQARLPRHAHAVLQVDRRVLEPQQQQQQDHADLRAHREKLFACVDLEEATLAYDEAREKVQRHRGDADAGGEAAEPCQHEEDHAKFDEHDGGLVWRGGRVRRARHLRGKACLSRSGWCEPCSRRLRYP